MDLTEHFKGRITAVEAVEKCLVFWVLEWQIQKKKHKQILRSNTLFNIKIIQWAMYLNALRVFLFLSIYTLISQKELGFLDEAELTRDAVPLFQELLFKVFQHIVAKHHAKWSRLRLGSILGGFHGLNAELWADYFWYCFLLHKEEGSSFSYLKKSELGNSALATFCFQPESCCH